MRVYAPPQSDLLLVFLRGFRHKNLPRLRFFGPFATKGPGRTGIRFLTSEEIPDRSQGDSPAVGRSPSGDQLPSVGASLSVPCTGSARRLVRPTETLRRDSRSRRSRPSVEDRRLFPPSEAPRARGGEARKGRARELRIAPRVVGGPLLMVVLPEHSPPVFETLIRGGRPPLRGGGR